MLQFCRWRPLCLLQTECIEPVVTPVGSTRQEHVSKGQRDKHGEKVKGEIGRKLLKHRIESYLREQERKQRGKKKSSFKMFGFNGKHMMY